MFRAKLCDLLGIEVPVILAGMGGVARADLVAAISNAGGLGVIGAAAMEPDELRAEIRRVKEMTDKPFGVDILLPAGVPETRTEGGSAGSEAPRAPRPSLAERFGPQVAFVNQLRAQAGLPPRDELPRQGRSLITGDFIRRQIDAILAEEAPVFATGLGNPAPYMAELRAAGMKVISLCGNVRAARRLAAAGVDVVVAQGHEAGGHTGRIGTIALVPQVVDAVGDQCLVVAAGGIGDGRAIVAALALGAAGVWIGTRFIATPEAYAHPAYKQRLVEMTEEDTRVTRAYSGKTARVVANQWAAAWESPEAPPTLPMPYQSLVIGHDVLVAPPDHPTGNPDVAMMPAGQIGGLLQDIKPAAEVLREMVAEAERVLDERLPAAVVARRRA